MALIWKEGLFLTYFSSGKRQKNFFSTYLTLKNARIVLIAHLYFFMRYQFCKKYDFFMYGFSLVRLLVLILIWTILEQSLYLALVRPILEYDSTTW